MGRGGGKKNQNSVNKACLRTEVLSVLVPYHSLIQSHILPFLSVLDKAKNPLHFLKQRWRSPHSESKLLHLTLKLSRTSLTPFQSYTIQFT